MKKRMLITTIVMMLVLAVALTTSSLAWFSATQNNVTATGGEFYAISQSGSNVNIAISNEMQGYTGSIVLEKLAAESGLKPMCMQSAYNNDGKVILNGAQVNGGYFAPGTYVEEEIDLATSTHETLSNAYHYIDTIYLVNYDETAKLGSISIKVDSTLQKAPTAAESAGVAVPVALLRVSRNNGGETWTEVGVHVLVLDGTNRYTIYNLEDVLMPSGSPFDGSKTDASLSTAHAQKNTLATVTDGTYASFSYEGTAVFDFTKGGTLEGLNVGGTEIAKIDVLMWFDGNTLTSATQQTLAQLGLTITGTPVAAA